MNFSTRDGTPSVTFPPEHRAKQRFGTLAKCFAHEIADPIGDHSKCNLQQEHAEDDGGSSKKTKDCATCMVSYSSNF